MSRGDSNRKDNSKGNRRRNDNRNRKGKNHRMAIVHVAFKSSSQAPPAAAHARYLAREGQYQQRGGVELVEFGNMPEFAQADPHSFWVAADAHERANGRTYTELQIALPRELEPAQRQELAREATRELLGDRFAYTLAVHTPLAKDNIEQPHLHLMFSERAVTAATREMPEERFFKRNGAKKDPGWNDQNKPEEVRGKWVAMMNGAMQRAGIEQRLDARSWAEQGRGDLASLREEKTLQGFGPDAMERHAEIDQLRQERAELAPPHLDRAGAIQHLEQQAEQQIAGVQARTSQELSRLDKLIAAARELANEVKERTVAVAQNVAERVEQLRGQFERWREQRVEGKPEQHLETQRPSPAQEKQELERAGPAQAVDASMSSQIEQRLQAFRERYEANKQEREPAVVPEPPAQEAAVKQEPEQELKIEREIGFGIGL
ncbi:MobA/MobL family protein [Granulicella arctica]|uniref:MobA/MobL family protein n=1 Tax=Granulicella arctica TaxID=940613 RepID=UPI0021DF86F0|nr:MobA/MobL family protein [Granulicella arctica]